MAVESAMLPLGTNAPDFSLRDVVHGQIYRLDSFNEKAAFLVMFICRHCPYVVHVEQEIARIGRDYVATGLGLIAISSNEVRDIAFPPGTCSPSSIGQWRDDFDN